MESNCSKANNDNDVWHCECTKLGEDERSSVKQSADELHVPCMKSSRSGSNVSD